MRRRHGNCIRSREHPSRRSNCNVSCVRNPPGSGTQITYLPQRDKSGVCWILESHPSIRVMRQLETSETSRGVNARLRNQG